MATISIRLNTLLLLVLILMAGAIIAILATRASGGPLDPPGAPSASGTLPQVEPRSPIPPVGWAGTFPIQITQSGSYFLTRSLTTPGGVNGIEISASNVTLDLGGFTLDGANLTGTGIITLAAGDNVSVADGAVTRFQHGIDLSTFTGGRISGVQVYLLNSGGTAISVSQRGLLEDCIVSNVGVGVRISEASMRRCVIDIASRDGVVAGASSVVDDNVILRAGFFPPAGGPWYGIRVQGSNVEIKGNDFDGNGLRDVRVESGIANVIDNSVYCPQSVTQASSFLMVAPMGSEPHANIPRVASGSC